MIALQASENPAMMAVVSQLQHAVLTMPWPVRCAAAQAIAKVQTLSFLSVGAQIAGNIWCSQAMYSALYFILFYQFWLLGQSLTMNMVTSLLYSCMLLESSLTEPSTIL